MSWAVRKLCKCSELACLRNPSILVSLCAQPVPQPPYLCQHPQGHEYFSLRDVSTWGRVVGSSVISVWLHVSVFVFINDQLNCHAMGDEVCFARNHIAIREEPHAARVCIRDIGQSVFSWFSSSYYSRFLFFVLGWCQFFLGSS